MPVLRAFPPRPLLALSAALALVACSAGETPPVSGPATATPAAPVASDAAATTASAADVDTRTAMVDEIAATLQACSYDGAPVRVDSVSDALPSDCREMVAQIMRFTGLPQNFTVVEAKVPNAAALIMLDEKKIPQRVIAFNRDFINVVRAATGGNAWAPVSIMAHEIGHHLSGHTITPGGSQPPTELEADKFSGFVLYKMGASLSDAQAAMAELVREGPDGPTHPGRGKRLAAIGDGWRQACLQQGGADCAAGEPLVQSPPSSPRPEAPVTAAPRLPAPPAAAPIATPAPATAATSAGTAAVDHVPPPGSTPSKLDRFIYDEFGVLDATWKQQFEQAMFAHARDHGVEIVTLLVRDLHGLDGDAYAHAMMRQLRVGKLDVGNGAVLVVAPLQNQVGLAMGPGVALQMGGHDKKAQLQRWLDSAWTLCQRKNACGNWSENFMLAADHIRRDTDDIEWTIRYQSLGALMQAKADYDATRRDSGFDPVNDPGYQKIVQIEGDVVAVDVQPGYAGAFVNDVAVRGRRAVHVQGGDGYTLMLYVDPRSEALMPAGALQPGARYRFVTRVDSLSWNKKDTQSFDLLSWDRLH